MEIVRPKRKASVLEDKAANKVTALRIEEVIGLSQLSSDAVVTVASCPVTPDVLCYPAGPFAIVYSISARQQLQLLRSTTSNRALLCICWSMNGEHIAAGEDGTQAAVLIWSVKGGKLVHELKAHKHSIASMCFSTNGRMLATLGSPHDGQLCVWDWQGGTLLWTQSVSACLSATFTEDSSTLLAVGKGFFKAWSITTNTQQQDARSKAVNLGTSSTTVSFVTRPVTLKELRSSTFVDVCMAPCQPAQPLGSNGVYALVRTGVLVLMRPTGRIIDKSVNLQVPAAYAVAASPTQVAAACAHGVVRLFSSKSLSFRATLPRFMARGQESAAAADPAKDTAFPDARGCSFSPVNGQQLVVAYADQSIIVWSIQNIEKITCVVSLSSHSGCIWDVCPLDAPVLVMSGEQQQQQPCRAATCAADGTVRLWNLAPDTAGGPRGRLLAGVAYAQDSGRPVQLRCMRISTDCRHICTGDQRGNLRVFDSVTLKPVLLQEAHDDEVLCLDYSPMSSHGGCLAASGSRDTLIHLYDVQQRYLLVETLDDHSAAVMAVRFTAGGKGLVSCGADRSIIFRLLGNGPGGSSAAYHIETLPHSLLYDLALDPLDQYIVTTGQDGLLRQWDVATGALQRMLTPEPGAGEPLKLCIDPGGVVLISCHADGCLRLYSLATGQLLWRAWGHADMVASAAVSPDLRRLVSVGGDGCIIVWRLPEQLVGEMKTAVARVAAARMHMNKAPQQQQHRQQIAGDLQQRTAWGACTFPVDFTPASTSAAKACPKPTYAAAAGFATPPAVSLTDGNTPSCDPDALQRLRHGKPLVSTDKLPKWARPSASPHGLTSAKEQQYQQSGKWQALGRWQVSKELALHSDERQLEVPQLEDVDSTCQLSLESSSALGEASRRCTDNEVQEAPLETHGSFEPQQDWSGLGQDDDMVVIQDWAESSLANHNIQTAALPEDAAGKEPDQPLCRGDASQPPGGRPRVVKDLFREHFSSLEGIDTPQHVRPEHRQSLSAMFKAGRCSLIGTALVNAGTAYGGLSSSSAAERLVAECLPSGTSNEALITVPATSLHAAGHQSDQQLLQQKQYDPEGSNQQLQTLGQHAVKKRWRHGKMDEELADMRQRLSNLHALYQQQVLQRQASPRRARASSNSSDGVTVDGNQRQGHEQQAANAAEASALENSKPSQAGAAAADGCSTEVADSLSKRSSCRSQACSSKILSRSNSVPASRTSSSSIQAVKSAENDGNDENPSLPSHVLSRKALVSTPVAPPLPPGPVPTASLVRASGMLAAGPAPLPPHSNSTKPAGQVSTAVESGITPATEAAEQETVEASEVQGAAAPGSDTPQAEVAHGGEAAPSSNSSQATTTQVAAPVPHDAAAAAVSELERSRLDDQHFSTGSDKVASPNALPAEDNGRQLAQLLADSPDPASHHNSNEMATGASTVAAAKLAKLKRGIRPTNCADVHAPASPAAIEDPSAAAEDGGDSPTPVVKSAAQAVLRDSGNRVSIGTSIVACDGAHVASNMAAEPACSQGRSGSPTRSSLNLMLPMPAANSREAMQSGATPSLSMLINSGTEQNPNQVLARAVAVYGAARPESALGNVLLPQVAATITPYGQHTVWPGWGGADNWEGLTPTPTHNSTASADVRYAATANVAVDGLGPNAEYWSQQNPCFDMTPAGSSPGSAGCSRNSSVPFVQEAQVEEAMPSAADHPPPGTQHAAAPSDETSTSSSACLLPSNGTGSLIPGSAGSSPARPPSASGQSASTSASSASPRTPRPRHPGWTPSEQQQQQLRQVPETPMSTQQQCVQGAHETSGGNMQQHTDVPQDSGHQTLKELLADTSAQAHGACGALQPPQLQHLKQQYQQQQMQEGADELQSCVSSSVLSPAATSPLSTISQHLLQIGTTSSCSTSKKLSKSQLRREKAAAKAAAALAAGKHRISDPGSSGSPGSTMLSLLQRIKRTMPGMRTRTSSSGKTKTASASMSPQQRSPSGSFIGGCGDELDCGETAAVGQDDVGDKLGENTSAAWQPGEQAAGHSSTISLEDVKLDVQQTERLQHHWHGTLGAQTWPCPASVKVSSAAHATPLSSFAETVAASDPDTKSVSAAERVTWQHGTAAAAAAAEGSSTQHCTPARVAESVDRFRQCMQEMQQLWLNLSLGADDATELLPLLTPPQAALGGRQQPSSASYGGPLSGLSGIVAVEHADREGGPVVLVKQRLQDELLSGIWNLHATVVGSADGQTPAGPGHCSASGAPAKLQSQPRQQSTSPAQKQAGSCVVRDEAGLMSTPLGTCHPRSRSDGAVSGGQSPGSSAWSLCSPGAPSKEALEEVTTRICKQYTDILIRKLQGNKKPNTPGRSSHVRKHKHVQQHEQRHQEQ